MIDFKPAVTTSEKLSNPNEYILKDTIQDMIKAN